MTLRYQKTDIVETLSLLDTLEQDLHALIFTIVHVDWLDSHHLIISHAPVCTSVIKLYIFLEFFRPSLSAATEGGHVEGHIINVVHAFDIVRTPLYVIVSNCRNKYCRCKYIRNKVIGWSPLHTIDWLSMAPSGIVFRCKRTPHHNRYRHLIFHNPGLPV